MATTHNIAIAGHATCGKTTLLEELLFLSKATSRAGKVDDGSSILDSDAEEKERKNTIDASTCFIEQAGDRLNLVDTPGYPDFVGTVIDAFAAVETALIAVDAVAGIKVNTRRVWLESDKLHLARMIVITRNDLEGASFDERLMEIQDLFGAHCIPLTVPDQSGPGFSAIERVLGGSSERALRNQKRVVEAVVESNEDLMERYLMEEEISPEEIDAAFGDALVAGTIVPVFCVSAEKKLGLEEMLEYMHKLAPAHDAEVPRPMIDRAGNLVEESPVGGEKDPFLARVFKVVSDPFVGKLSYIRVYSGTVTPNMPFVNCSRGDAKERTSSLTRMQGKDPVNIDHGEPGDVLAVPKLESLEIGDTIAAASRDTLLAPVPHPTPMVKLAVEPKSRNDETKIGEALGKLAQGDSCFSVTRVAQTRELVVAGRSTLHLDVMLSRLKRRFDLEVNTHIPKTSYLESISTSSEAQHKHKKQSGGRGQYGEVYIRLEPGEKGSGLEFINAIVGGVIPTQFIPATEKGIREIMESGILADCPIQDCKVSLYDGSYHNVDSSEAAFKSAGREAFKKAYMAAKPVLLEPIVEIEVHMPTRFMGDISGDLNSRRGRISGMDTEGDTQVIRAHVPEAEIKSYSTELRSMTAGEGSYSLEFSHYEAVPSQEQEKIVAQLRKDKEEAEL